MLLWELIACKFWGVRSGVAEDSALLGRDPASLGDRIPTFRPVRMRPLRCVETSGCYYRRTQDSDAGNPACIVFRISLGVLTKEQNCHRVGWRASGFLLCACNKARTQSHCSIWIPQHWRASPLCLRSASGCLPPLALWSIASTCLPSLLSRSFLGSTTEWPNSDVWYFVTIFSISQEPQIYHHIFFLSAASSCVSTVVRTVSMCLKNFILDPRKIAAGLVEGHCPGKQ